jgi:large subunit ribosomal protein L15
MFLLNNLKKTVKNKKRVGRGGKYAKNAGAGHKGQVKRSGKSRLGFEGGQTSLIRRTPKSKGGNFNSKKRDLRAISLTVISDNFKDGEEVNIKSLLEKKIINRFIKQVRVINSGSLSTKPIFNEEIYLTKSVKELV